jgi:hypothetical protein
MPPNASSQDPGMTWLAFVLLTVVSWGVYGIFLHNGQTKMQDPANGLFKAFLFVGAAYFLVAIIAPFLMLVLRGANWKYPIDGMGWSLVAGVVGAIGAFGVLLAFKAGGVPPVVMALVFCGAPIVNAFVSIIQHPPEGGLGSIRYQFWLGIVLAAIGGFLVTRYKPAPSKKPAPVAGVVQTSAAH